MSNNNGSFKRNEIPQSGYIKHVNSSKKANYNTDKNNDYLNNDNDEFFDPKLSSKYGKKFVIIFQVIMKLETTSQIME